MSKQDDLAGSQPAPLASTSTTPQNNSRRRFLGGMAALSAGGALSACATDGQGNASYAAANPAEAAALDRALRENVKTIVVIYAENRSFNNLFANFPGLEKPLSSLKH